MSTNSQDSGRAQDNYPPEGDTTSEGGYGGQGAFAPVSERGLIDQTTDGQPLGNEIEDAWQGSDETATRKYRQEMNGQIPGQSEGLNPYGDSLETREEAGAALAAGATDARARTYQDEIADTK